MQAEFVGKRYAGATLSSFAVNGDNEKIAQWIKNNKNFLVFLGSPGVGKTYFCAALLPWVHPKVRSVRYWNERDLLARLREAISQEKGNYVKQLEYLLDDEFVMLDDMGSCGINDWRKEVWFEAIDMRYESQKPTVITSNMTRGEIFSSLGPRCHSRLFSKENLIIEMHDGMDLRQQNF